MKLIILIFIDLIGVIVVISDPVVQIKNGTLEGIFMHSRKGRKIAAFLGVPYAIPPLGELRFGPPRAASPWNGVLFVKNHSNMCTQRDIFSNQIEIVGDEDCLYLNVYTPQISPDESKKNKKNYPVMIWIHPGGFLSGAGNSDISSPKFLLDHELVFVTLNYRLGPLGFLSTGDLLIPGNQGMKDQAQAIRWVHENIAEFGGDPNRVTLFGESSGGASVHYHMMSPLSKGLFHQAISQSGFALCPWAFNAPATAKKNAQKLGKLFECPTNNSRQLLNCLRKQSHIDIIATDDKFAVFDHCPIVPFRPVIEPEHPGAFLTENPTVLSKNGKILDIPWLSGITSQEGAFKASRFFGVKNGELLKTLDENFETFGPISVLCEDKYPKNLLKKFSKSLRKFYFNDQSLDQSSDGLMNMYTDAWALFPLYNSLQDNLKFFSSPMYFYYFEYKGSTSLSVLFGDKLRDYGVCHGDDLQYLFPFGEQIFSDTPLNKEDNRMIDLMTKLWFNFVETGNPTPEITADISVKWNPITTNSLEYFHIKNSKNCSMEKNLLEERIDFWKNLSLIKDDFNFNKLIKDEL